MLGINLKHIVATVAVAAGLLISYNGHAGLGASVHQHKQTEGEFLLAGLKDGTSNTIMFGERAAPAGWILMTDSGGQFS